MRKAITVQEFVLKHDRKKLAKALRVNPITVLFWSRGSHLPRPDKFVELAKMSKGAICFKKTIETFAKR